MKIRLASSDHADLSLKYDKHSLVAHWLLVKSAVTVTAILVSLYVTVMTYSVIYTAPLGNRWLALHTAHAVGARRPALRTINEIKVLHKKAQLTQGLGLRATAPPSSEPEISPFAPPTPKTLA